MARCAWSSVAAAALAVLLLPRADAESACQTALPGSTCDNEVRWARSQGIYHHPEWYHNLTPQSTFEEFQAVLHLEHGKGCPMPCIPETTKPPHGKVPELEELGLPCKLPSETTKEYLVEVQRMNCVKVNLAMEQFNQTKGSSGSRITLEQANLWDTSGAKGSRLCQESEDAALSGELRDAALLAVQAWGIGIMRGTECCTLVHPPYCLESTWSTRLFSIHTPVGILVYCMLAIFVVTTFISCAERTRTHYRKKKANSPLKADVSEAPAAPLPTGTVGRPARNDLEELLRAEWLQHSSLRHLPKAEACARSSASLFAALQHAFDFQVDSCCNQYQHLLSLWRSHCAMVADRSVGSDAKVDEDELLVEGLCDLYEDLMDGYRLWRANFNEGYGFPEADELPTLGGVQWALLPATLTCGSVLGSVELSRKLAEVTAYLLIWGEAGNLRFMPEMIYFITSLVLAAEANPQGPLLGLAEGRSGLFLARVVRPLYHVVFDEWYQYVKMECHYTVDNSQLESTSSGLRYCFSEHVDDQDVAREPAAWGSTVKGLADSGWVKIGDRFLPMEVDGVPVLILKTEGHGKWKDVKKLKDGFDCYLPADVSNYDDWDEFFYDPDQVSGGLVLADERRLFDLPCGQRFAALPKVIWALALRASATKTHREVHSLWGIYASTHRIWLLHATLFLLGVCAVTGDPPGINDGRIMIGGRTAPVRFAAVGLLVPVHGLFWAYSRWLTLSNTAMLIWWRCRGFRFLLNILASAFLMVLWFMPLLTYAAIRYLEAFPQAKEVPGLPAAANDLGSFDIETLLMVHGAVSFIGLLTHLLLPGKSVDKLWPLTAEALHVRAARYTFWCAVLAVKFIMGLFVAQDVFQASQRLNLVSPGHESVLELGSACVSSRWSASVLQWLVLWCMTFLLYITDTQMWFILGCTLLGVIVTLTQRKCQWCVFASEDAVAKIPERFSEKVLPYTRFDSNDMSEQFPAIWNEIVDLLFKEDKCKNVFEKADLSFGSVRRKLFLPTYAFERLARQWCGVHHENGLRNSDMQWRISALSRGLGLPIPRPFRAPYIPGITVLIPHYGEIILVRKGDLWNDDKEETVPLMDWLSARYASEFEAFTNRMDKAVGALTSTDMHFDRALALSDWPEAGSNWISYQDHHWEKICTWASLRLQTLYRTVAGFTLYDRALQCHFRAQGLPDSSLARSWSPSDCFTCMVSMQMYKTFDKVMLQHTNTMFEKFPPSLQVAFIDWEDKDECAWTDGVHEHQERRYFSCLIDASCHQLADGRREPKFRVELPGFSILGDGKGDNQNHAIPFMRGTFCQCIDSNQGAYFEQMLFLPCVLGEFRTDRRGDGNAKRIIGLPEHITSDFGSIGDFAAGSEVAFGTILQRSYALLGGRMHYGHPDIMNKEFMMQQGGVSKATKTLNLSEDIFAGMDFTLRGRGRRIRHCEYFHLAKGRDLGFNTVLGFFSKLSSGAGEQILTRQMFRLGQLLHLPECLTFYYAHVGYYITQACISWSIPVVIFTWLLILMSDCEDTFRSHMDCAEEGAAVSLGRMLSLVYSFLLFAFLVCTSLPLLVENWMERGLKTALVRGLVQYLTLSPLVFIFQAKVIGYYVMNELRYGGATYVSTGRGLPTERRPFIGHPDKHGRFRIEDKDVGGLYLDYTVHTYYHGMMLFMGVLLVIFLGGVSDSGSYRKSLAYTWIAVGITLVSWLYAPFLFNPYQFSRKFFWKDVRAWVAFFFQENGRKWVSWYETKCLKPGAGLEKSVGDISFVLGLVGLASVFANMYRKLRLFTIIYSTLPMVKMLEVMTLIPPIFLSMTFTLILAIIEGLYKSVGGLHGSPSFEEATSSSGSEAKPRRSGSRARRVPLALSAMAVFILNVVEGIVPLLVLLFHSWQKAFVAGLVLKWMLFVFVLNLCETLLRYRCLRRATDVKRERCWCRPMQLWVQSNRMAWDLITSTFIFWTLSPLVIANSLNDWLAPGLNVHQLLIYRQAHLSPMQLEHRTHTGTSSESGSDADSDTSGAGLLRQQRHQVHG